MFILHIKYTRILLTHTCFVHTSCTLLMANILRKFLHSSRTQHFVAIVAHTRPQTSPDFMVEMEVCFSSQALSNALQTQPSEHKVQFLSPNYFKKCWGFCWGSLAYRKRSVLWCVHKNGLFFLPKACAPFFYFYFFCPFIVHSDPATPLIQSRVVCFLAEGLPDHTVFRQRATLPLP